MDAGLAKAAGRDIFDLFGDAVGTITRAVVEHHPLSPVAQAKFAVEHADQAADAAKAWIESPFTGYGLLKHGFDAAREHPTLARHALDAATVLNPVVAWGRGIASIFG